MHRPAGRRGRSALPLRHHADAHLRGGALLLRLTASGFRNLEPLTLEPAPGRNLVLGPNGAGKTSLLEAVYVLATTRSFRARRLRECCRHGESSFQLAGRVGGEPPAELALAWDGAGMARSVDRSPSPLVRHLDVLPVVSWTSGDEELLAGGPAGRRRFMDQGVVGLEPGALQPLSRYRRALEQKRELLQGRTAGGLGAWNEVLAEAAEEIAGRRARFVDRLAARLSEALEALELGLPQVTLRYRPSPPDALDGRRAVLSALESARRRELDQQRALTGPHLDELEILWGGREVRRVASAGERKLAGLALAAARARVLDAAGRHPLLLLDDLDAELDRGRVEAAWRLFEGFGQALVTSSREGPWQALEPTAEWRLEGGTAVSRPETQQRRK